MLTKIMKVNSDMPPLGNGETPLKLALPTHLPDLENTVLYIFVSMVWHGRKLSMKIIFSIYVVPSLVFLKNELKIWNWFGMFHFLQGWTGIFQICQIEEKPENYAFFLYYCRSSWILMKLFFAAKNQWLYVISKMQ